MSKQTDSQGREVFSVHPKIRQEAAGYRTTGTPAQERETQPQGAPARHSARDTPERTSSENLAEGDSRS